MPWKEWEKRRGGEVWLGLRLGVGRREVIVDGSMALHYGRWWSPKWQEGVSWKYTREGCGDDAHGKWVVKRLQPSRA